MNFKLALKLMTIPTLIGSLLALGLFTEEASAINASNATVASCDARSSGELRSSRLRHGDGATLVASTASIVDETEEFDFTEAESDASAALFGCDCSSCINALRQLRNPSLVDSVNGKGHCWISMQRRVSPEKVQQVLQDLEMKEAK